MLDETMIFSLLFSDCLYDMKFFFFLNYLSAAWQKSYWRGCYSYSLNWTTECWNGCE